MQRQYTRLYYAVNFSELLKKKKKQQQLATKKYALQNCRIDCNVFKKHPTHKNIRARVNPAIRKKPKKKTAFFGNKYRKMVI